MSLTVIQASTTPKFELGAVVMTAAVSQHFTREQLLPLIQRHHRGDWGLSYEEDAAANDAGLSVSEPDRLHSVYELDGMRVWIITEADRSATTVLFPEDY